MRSLINGISDFRVVGEAGTGQELLRKVAELQPDVVLVDIAMPELNGLEATERLNRDYPGIGIIILSMHSQEEYVIQALRAGAAGYLVKDAAPPELEIAIRSVLRGRIYLSPAISRTLIEDYLKRNDEKTHLTADADKEQSPFTILTPRQREILQLVAEGCTTKEIAGQLNISVKTVESHRTQIMERLHIHDIAGLVRYAIRTGLISPER